MSHKGLFYIIKSEKFEIFLLKNHLLSFVINNNSSSKCLFLYALNTLVLDTPDTSAATTAPKKTSPTLTICSSY